ncbi:hypothetical protein L1987_46345 [Smallanthus sonchifolius]|uniref:Uncharacterized protein n=1 Tax=Smallanthus sonchifolius TaxID=185202 RepID=A0ACB9FYX5_9ASTR|nr:hypothetical protein L1987_46345 [Smallanthus sonchifolius]
MTNTKVVGAVTIEKGILNAFEPLKESGSSFGTIELEGIARVEMLEGALRWVVTTISTITSINIITTISTIVAIGGIISLSELCHELCKNSSNVGIGVGRGSTTRRHSTDFHKTIKDESIRITRLIGIYAKCFPRQKIQNTEDKVSITRNNGELIANGRKGFRRRRAWFPASSATIPVASSGSVASGRIVCAFAWENCKQFGEFDGLVRELEGYELNR